MSLVGSSYDNQSAASLSMQIAGLSKRYGEQRALSEVSFDIHPREILGLIGPNGAGKTTLLEAMAGILPVDAGHVSWHGALLLQARRRDAIFYLPDGLRPWADQFVVQALGFFGEVYGHGSGRLAETMSLVVCLPCWRSVSVLYQKGMVAGLCWP